MNSIHFIGVSGIGVSAVAKISIQSGIRVTGSADEENEQTHELVRLGACFSLGHQKEHIENPDLVVRSAAVPDDNPEVLEARRKSIPVLLYSDYLGMLMAQKKGIGIAGTHGKTTTTAITGVVLEQAGLFPSIVCGGVMNDYSSNALAGKGEYFVAEACEYNRSFLSLNKQYAVVTNIERDHLDTYDDLDDIKHAFALFLATTRDDGFAVVNGDDSNVMDAVRESGYRSVHTVGVKEENSYRIIGLEEEDGRYFFGIERGRQEAVRLTLPLPGRYNCINASLSAVLCIELGVERKRVEESIAGFAGIERRLELLGSVNRNPVYSDYAHHPTEISGVIDTLRLVYPSRKLVIIFQPHQYSRTMFLFEGFVKALSGADLLILTGVYRQRDDARYTRAVSSIKLHEVIGQKKRKGSVYIEEKYDILPYLEEHPPEGAVVAFMGAGDIDKVARKYVGK
jgi:UDP-N-acetylmuramate--alanine ligase